MRGLLIFLDLDWFLEESTVKEFSGFQVNGQERVRSAFGSVTAWTTCFQAWFLNTVYAFVVLKNLKKKKKFKKQFL